MVCEPESSKLLLASIRIRSWHSLDGTLLFCYSLSFDSEGWRNSDLQPDFSILSRERTLEIINRFPKNRVMIVGDLMVDKYIRGSCIRLSTEAPIPVIQVLREDYSLGGAANIAHHITNLGGTAHLAGIVGYDDAAHHLRKQVSQSKINAAGIFPSSHRPTTQKVRILSIEHSHLMGRFDYESTETLTQDEEASMRRFIETYSDEIDAMILSDYDKGLFNSSLFIDFLKDISKRLKFITIAQSRTSQPEKFAWVDTLVLGQKQANQFLIAKTNQNITEIEKLGKQLQNLIHVRSMLLYDSPDQSMILFKKNQMILKCKNPRMQLIDLTGMGDATLAITALALSAKATDEEALELAFRGFLLAGQQVGTGQIFIENLLA
jgi:rfaE bifunctional protein kinase chain/domain